jgi:hypothetical protein
MCSGSDCYDTADVCMNMCPVTEPILAKDWTVWIIVGSVAGFIALSGLVYLIYAKTQKKT